MENINQIPNLQPIQPVKSVKNQNIFKYLFIVSIVVLLGVIVGFYYVLNNKINQLSNKQTTEITPIPTQTTETNTEVVPSTIPTITSTESTFVEKDANNNLYTNNKVGFSLVIPKIAISRYGLCQKINDYFQSVSAKVPITFFEGSDTTYFSGQYFYNLIGEEIAKNGISKYSDCQKETPDFHTLERQMIGIPSFKIYAANIKSDNELEQFIKDKFGSGCKLGQKTQITNSDIYSVKVLGDGKDLGETKCPINFQINLKYNQTKGKLVIFELGQDCQLYKGIVGSDGCYDTEIMNSLKFN